MMNANNINSKPVWDIAVRVFHWSLVAGFVTAYLSGEEEASLHANAGYIVLGLIVFRIIWGFIGGKHARFSDFIFPPAEILAYAWGIFTGKAKDYTGHNPLGGLMVLALLFSILATSISGLKVYGLEGHGPLAAANNISLISSAYASKPHTEEDGEDDEEAEHWWEEVHEFFANFTVFLLVFHIMGVVVSSRLHNENLVKAMLTGNKTPLRVKEGE